MKRPGRLSIASFLLCAAAALAWARGAGEASGCRPPFVPAGAQPGVPALGFMAAGDTGTGGTGQEIVARAMAAYAAANPEAFVLLLGDNFYGDGVDSTTDPQWQMKFERIYAAAALPMPFYAVLGNHDDHGDPLAEIAYTRPGTRWTMPGRYYKVSRALPDGTGIDLFAIDTNTIARDAAQLAWLDRGLAASTARWKIVFGHHPVYSNGRHGNDQRLIDVLVPLFTARGVDLYLAGHDHDLQILRPQGGVRYLVDGAGSRTRPTACAADTEYATSRLGFMAFRVSRRELAVSVVLRGAKVDYSTVIRKP